MKSVGFANVIACEFATLGAGGKHILVNVYTGNILVREFPATFPISFYIEFFIDPDRTTELKIEILINDEIKGEVQAELAAGGELDIGLIVLPQIPLQFLKAGALKIVASGPRHRRTVLMQKTVTAGPIPD